MASLSFSFLTLSLLSLLVCTANAQLSATFYARSCPNLENIVRSVMTQAIKREPRMGASILRLFFHDCFVNGCDASILLDDAPTFRSEKNAGPNLNSARGFEVIDAIKTQVEAACKATVSCADILTLAARDGVNLLGGPTWAVPLGRRDSTTADFNGANRNLPGPDSDLSDLIKMFADQGLTAPEMTTLSGAHTIGQARCAFFRRHIYRDPNVNASFAALRRQNCPSQPPAGDNNLAPFDIQSPNRFDNRFYQNLLNRNGLLHSDQELFNGGSQDGLVRFYSNHGAAFASDFAAAMVKLGNITPLTGTRGQIRLNCRKVNNPSVLAEGGYGEDGGISSS